MSSLQVVATTAVISMLIATGVRAIEEKKPAISKIEIELMQELALEKRMDALEKRMEAVEDALVVRPRKGDKEVK